MSSKIEEAAIALWWAEQDAATTFTRYRDLVERVMVLKNNLRTEVECEVDRRSRDERVTR